MSIQAAAVYLRISSDREGDHLGVERQRADCRALAERRGWRIADEYEDNDVSAWSGATRPQYRRMLADIAERSVDAVIVYDQDRLTRQPRDLEEFLDVCDGAGVTQIATVSGVVDLSTDEGRCMARMFGAMNRKSSDDTSRRIRRKHDELAEAGKISGGGARPYGFDQDRRTVIAEEAAVIVEAATRALAGDSVRSICADLDERGIRTASGGKWNPSVMTKMLRSGRISGQREHLGEIVGPAEWPAIITAEQTAGLRATVGAARRSSARSPRSYLLAGLLRCELCGATLVSRPRAGGVRQYVCANGPGLAGCGKISVLADPVEHLVVDGVTAQLDTKAFAQAVQRGATTNVKTEALRVELAAHEAKNAELTDMWVNGEISRADRLRAAKEIDARIEAVNKKLSRLKGTRSLDGYVGQGETLRAKWDGLDLARQHAIVSAVLDHAVVAPAVRGRNIFDEHRIKPVWKR